MRNFNRCERGREEGFSIMEVMVAGAILAIALVALFHVMVTSTTVTATNRETALATEAARQMIEQMQSATFTQVFSLYNGNLLDDPGGAGTAPGKNFAVTGLRPLTGDADGKVGEIIFPVDAGNTLRENVNDPLLGMPRDLNGDNVVDAADHSANYILLPVTIRLEWISIKGDRFIEIRTMVSAR